MEDSRSVLMEWLEYIPETGYFYWRKSPCHNTPVGSIAGTVTADRYWRIKFQGKRYLAHRLAWLFYYGNWPSEPLDHIDTRGTNNRIANLRLATPRLNAENKRFPAATNQCGYLGVCAVGNRFKAGIGSRGRRLHLGTFDSAEEAHEAYVFAKRQLHEGCTL